MTIKKSKALINCSITVVLVAVLISLPVMLLTGCFSEDDPAGSGDATPSEYYLEVKDKLSEREVAYVTMEIEGYGNIKLALDATAAPITVRHFLKLAKEGFYNGLTFHRSAEIYMMGGDPAFDGSGYAKDDEGNIITAEGEFKANGYEGNDISHKRGVISMLRFSNSYDSASSQFFICSADIADLNGKYAAFGYVCDGMDVLDAMVERTERLTDYYGFLQRIDQPVIKSVTIDSLGGIDPNEVRVIERPDASEYKDSRDTNGRETVLVDIKVKDYGTVRVLLDRTTAPVTVDNFLKLVGEGFYDGLTFHRVMSGFMVQGGDPDANGSGGYKDGDGNKVTIKGEFKANGYEGNDISHKRGTISMARGGSNMDSASSQFFICNADSTFLDGKYASFGYVVSGLRVVDKITRDTAIFGDGNGKIADKDKHAVIESVRVVTE